MYARGIRAGSGLIGQRGDGVFDPLASLVDLLLIEPQVALGERCVGFVEERIGLVQQGRWILGGRTVVRGRLGLPTPLPVRTDPRSARRDRP